MKKIKLVLCLRGAAIIGVFKEGLPKAGTFELKPEVREDLSF